MDRAAPSSSLLWPLSSVSSWWTSFKWLESKKRSKWTLLDTFLRLMDLRNLKSRLCCDFAISGDAERVEARETSHKLVGMTRSRLWEKERSALDIVRPTWWNVVANWSCVVPIPGRLHSVFLFHAFLMFTEAFHFYFVAEIWCHWWIVQRTCNLSRVDKIYSVSLELINAAMKVSQN